jgi:hypothetical protein
MMEGRSRDYSNKPVYCYHDTESDFYVVVDAEGHKQMFTDERAAVRRFRELTIDWTVGLKEE